MLKILLLYISCYALEFKVPAHIFMVASDNTHLEKGYFHYNLQEVKEDKKLSIFLKNVESSLRQKYKEPKGKIIKELALKNTDYNLLYYRFNERSAVLVFEDSDSGYQIKNGDYSTEKNPEILNISHFLKYKEFNVESVKNIKKKESKGKITYTIEMKYDYLTIFEEGSTVPMLMIKDNGGDLLNAAKDWNKDKGFISLKIDKNKLKKIKLKSFQTTYPVDRIDEILRENASKFNL